MDLLNATSSDSSPGRVFKAVGRFIPTVETPTTIIIPLHVASVLLLLACFTLTYRNALATTIRVMLFAPIAYLCYDVAYGSHPCPTRSVSMGLTLMGWFGIARAWDICIVGLMDAEPPVWVQNGKRLPLPTTFGGRFMYALDSVR